MSIVNGMRAGANSYGSGVWIPEENNVIVASSIDILNSAGNPIGYVVSVSPRQTQARTVIRHLNAIDAGRPIEIIPGVPEYSLDAAGFHLYCDREGGPQDTLVNRFLYGSGARETIHSLADIDEYFDIAIRFSHPGSKGGRGGEWWFRKCAITAWNMGDFSITGDLAISQSISMVCLAVEFKKYAGKIEPRTPGGVSIVGSI